MTSLLYYCLNIDFNVKVLLIGRFYKLACDEFSAIVP